MYLVKLDQKQCKKHLIKDDLEINECFFNGILGGGFKTKQSSLFWGNDPI